MNGNKETFHLDFSRLFLLILLKKISIFDYAEILTCNHKLYMVLFSSNSEHVSQSFERMRVKFIVKSSQSFLSTSATNLRFQIVSLGDNRWQSWLDLKATINVEHSQLFDSSRKDEVGQHFADGNGQARNEWNINMKQGINLNIKTQRS